MTIMIIMIIMMIRKELDMIFKETDTTELKEKITPDLTKEVIAFANTNGGTIYIGVDNNGNIIGIENYDAAILQINNMIRDSIKPDITMFVRYNTLTVDEKQIVSVTVDRGTNRPYYLASKGLKPNGVYVRNGTASDPSSDTAIRSMIKETDGDSFEKMRSLEQNLTFEAAKREFSEFNIKFGNEQMKTLGILNTDGIYTNVGLLISDQCRHMIKVAVFSGNDKTDFQDRREYSGSLFRQMEEVYDFIDIHNRVEAHFEGLRRIDKNDYPKEALRESLLNCIVHRDYSYSADTMISIFCDRIEFVSVGGLPAGVSLNDIMLGLSVCRNEKLARIFYQLKLIEAYGTGVPKIMSAYKASDKKPVIEVSDNAFKITLPNLNYNSSFKINDDEKNIIEFIKSKGSVTRPDIDKLLNISQSTSGRMLKRLCEKGLIKKLGSGKNSKYSI